MMLHNTPRPQAAAAGPCKRTRASRKPFRPFTSSSSSRPVRAAAAAAEQQAAVATPGLASPLSSVSPLSSADEFNQHVREGHYEAPLMQEQVCEGGKLAGHGQLAHTGCMQSAVKAVAPRLCVFGPQWQMTRGEGWLTLLLGPPPATHTLPACAHHTPLLTPAPAPPCAYYPPPPSLPASSLL